MRKEKIILLRVISNFLKFELFIAELPGLLLQNRVLLCWSFAYFVNLFSIKLTQNNRKYISDSRKDNWYNIGEPEHKYKNFKHVF